MKESRLIINGVPRGIAVRTARGFARRFLGLMGRRTVTEGLFFPRCAGGIHTFFMRNALDVVLLDGESRVLALVENLPPWRVLLPRNGTAHVLELPPGAVRRHELKVGDVLSLASP